MSSEVQDAVQVVAVCGRSAYLVGDLTVKAALTGAKLIQAIYLARWKGKVGFNRLLRIKGEENGLTFINVGIEPNSKENKKIFNDILQEFKAHKIMYSVMPDLCAGDGSTQIAISNLDAGKFVAMAIDHKHGKHGNIQLAEITQYDYTMTGQRGDGTLTPEAEGLLNSAKKISQRAKNWFQKHFGNLIHKIKKFLNLENEFEFLPPAVVRYDLQKTVSENYQMQSVKSAGTQMQSLKTAGTQMQSLKTAGTKMQRYQWSGKGRQNGRLINLKQISGSRWTEQNVLAHDSRVVYGKEGYAWVKLPPILSAEINGEKFYLVPLPDGVNAVVVPEKYYREPLLSAELSDSNSTYGCVICKGKKYRTVNLETKETAVLGGEKVIEAAKKLSIADYGKKLENLRKNLQVNKDEAIKLVKEVEQAMWQRKK